MILLALAGCQPYAERVEPTCLPDAPAAGEVRVAEITCAEMAIPGGSGGVRDFWMANARFRAVLRHPQASATVPGVGGMTVIDAAPWGENDRLHEVIPLVGGGWLEVDTVDLAADRITVGGVIASLRDRPADRAGERAEVAWVIAADEPWLRLDGADGLWIHPSGTFDLLDGQLVHDRLVYGHDGAVAADLGGAVRVTGTSLLVAPPAEAYGLLYDRPVSGTAEGATRALFFDGDELVGRVPVVSGAFGTRVPDRVDGVAVESAGAGRTARQPPAEGLTFDLRARGWVDLEPTWDGLHARPFGVTFRSDDGRIDEALAGPDGGRLALGSGGATLTLHAGPEVVPVTVRVDVPDDEVVDLGFTLRARFDPGDRVLAILGWPGDGSRSWRGTDAEALYDAWRAGARFVVTAPEDEVGTANGALSGLPTLLQIDGSRTVSDDGWSVVSWPWSPDGGKAGHGAVDPAGLTAADIVSVAKGGPSGSRRVVADLAFFEAVPRPWEADPFPDHVRLAHPGPDGPHEAWAPWLAWLDSGVFVPPVGPLTWVDVADATAVPDADVLAGLAAGATVATTGPLVVVRAAGATHGEVVDPTRLPDEVVVTGVGTEDLDELVLFGDGGTEWTWAPTGARIDDTVRLQHAHHWLMAAGWDAAGDHWIATSPVWLEAPVGGVSPTAP